MLRQYMFSGSIIFLHKITFTSKREMVKLTQKILLEVKLKGIECFFSWAFEQWKRNWFLWYICTLIFCKSMRVLPKAQYLAQETLTILLLSDYYAIIYYLLLSDDYALWLDYDFQHSPSVGRWLSCIIAEIAPRHCGSESCLRVTSASSLLLGYSNLLLDYTSRKLLLGSLCWLGCFG